MINLVGTSFLRGDRGMDKDLIIGDVLQELAGTRRMLEKLTQEHMTWKPHEKSMSLGGLSTSRQSAKLAISHSSSLGV